MSTFYRFTLNASSYSHQLNLIIERRKIGKYVFSLLHLHIYFKNILSPVYKICVVEKTNNLVSIKWFGENTLKNILCDDCMLGSVTLSRTYCLAFGYDRRQITWKYELWVWGSSKIQ